MPATSSPSSTARGFGRRQPFVHAEAMPATPVLGDDFKLFLLTFAAGFLFTSIYLA